MYLLTTLIAYNKSGREQTIKYMRDPTALDYGTGDKWSMSSSNFKDKVDESLK